jgi:hypothetical protein
VANALRKKLKKADEYLTNLSIGAGRGLTTQLEGVLGMVEHPVQTAQAFGQLARNPRQIPGMVGNALVDAATRATRGGPIGLGEVLGENMSPRAIFRPNALLGRTPPVNELITYHGSPHEFDDFNLFNSRKSSSGATKGPGIYLAENKNQAKWWAKFGANAGEGGTGEYVYSVEIPDDVAPKLLDWDAPIGEQSANVKKIIAEMSGDDVDAMPPEMTVGQALEAAGIEDPDIGKTLAKLLRRSGHPGIKYIGEPGIFENGRNFVIFDPDLAKILKRE